MNAPTLDPVVGQLLRDYASLNADQLREFHYTVRHPEDTPEQPKRKVTWSLDELLAEQFPEPRWAVPSLLPVGLSILAGRPKVGKSWLALQIALAVSAGGYALGRKVERGRSLFIALEDSPRRLQSRLLDMGAAAGGNLDIVTDWPPLLQGGLLELETVAARYDLVCIDTLSRLAAGLDQDDISEMTATFGQLQQIALNSDAALLFNDHHRKASVMGANVVDDVMGSTGKAAVADCIWGLYKQQGKRGADLRVTGRDLDEQTLHLVQDRTTHAWQVDQSAGDDHLTPQRAELVKLIAEMGGATLNDLVEATGRNKGTIHRQLVELEGLGKVVNEMGVWILKDKQLSNYSNHSN